MSMKELNFELREKTGKGICRQLRTAGRVPAVVYGKGFTSTAISVDQRELLKVVSGDGGKNSLITLNGADPVNGSVVLVENMLLNPIKGTPRHVDLHKVNYGQKMRVAVNIKLVGTAKGVKDGGLLELLKHSVEIECLPMQIPAHIDVDVTDLTIGHSIHASALKLPEGVRLLDSGESTIVSIIGKAVEVEAPVEG